MYNSFNVIFNSISSDELDINVIARPQIPSPQPRIKPIDIPGAQGKQYEIDGYEDIEIQVEFNFISQEDLHEKFRKCKRWINNIEDNAEFIYNSITRLDNVTIYIPKIYQK